MSQTRVPPRGGFGGRGPMMMVQDEKARNFGGTIRRLVLYLGFYRLPVLLVFLLGAASTLFSILGPRVLGHATTLVFTGMMDGPAGAGNIDFTAVSQTLLTVLVLYGLSTLLSVVMGLAMSHVASDLSRRFRQDISLKINRIPLAYYDKVTHGEVLSRITNDVDTINQTLSQSLTQIITSAITVAGVVVMMFSIDWRMTLTALTILPLSFFLVRFLVARSQRYFKGQQSLLGQLNGHVEEMYGGHVVMKAFGGEDRSIKKFSGLNQDLHASAWKAQFLSGIMMPMMNFVGNLGYVAVVIVGGWLAVRRAVTVGEIQAFIQYIRNFTHPISQIANISNILQQTAAAAERVFEFLDKAEEPADSENPVSPDKIRGMVEFRDLHFGYLPDKPVIGRFSALARAGQKVAIVGPTGAGKTTLVKLLLRFYDVDSGTILVDGTDIRRFGRKSLRSLFAMVLQDTWLFNGTIMENIRYGRPDAGDEEVMAAARAAHADHFIHTLPDGYRMELNEETTNISHGQKQLLTIARAILADPKILILDEATSSVDTRTELQIQKAMDALMVNRTSFVIAHRLSTIRNADLILVMNEGGVVEQGTHLNLLAAGGFYADLYRSQFEPLLT